MNNIMVTLNGSTLNFDSEDQKPIEYNNRTIMPIRKIFEEMGYTVEWVAGTGSNPKGTLTIIDKRNGTSETVVICKEGDNNYSVYGVTYSYNDIYNIDYANTVVGGRLMIPIRPILERFGYEVDWNNNDNTSIVIIKTPTANTYSVNYEYNGGKFITKRNIVNKGNYVTLPSPTREGYYLVGWYMGLVDGTCVGKGGSSYKPTASVTLYARWSDEYTVTYVANGGSIENSSVPVKMNQSVTLPKPSRQGYKFEGWYTAATGGNKIGNAGASYTPVSDVILYAQWSIVIPTFPRIRYGSTKESNFENVDCGSIEGHTLENLKFKQLDNRTDVSLKYAGSSVKSVLNDGSSCVLYSYAMVLYALQAKITKYDYRTDSIHEMDADPYSCLMANIGVLGDWSEAASGQVTIRTEHFYLLPNSIPVTVVYSNLLSAFGYRFTMNSQKDLIKGTTLESAKSNAEAITTALSNHPEGVIVRNGTNTHSFVVVDSTFRNSNTYTTIEDIGSCFTVYDSADTLGGNSNGGINFNESWTFKDGGRFSNLTRYDVIIK